MKIKTVGRYGKASLEFVLLAVIALLSFAYATSLVSAGKSPSALPSPPSITSASLAVSNSIPPVIASASIDPLKVRPGDSMLISVQASDPSGIFSVSAGMVWVEPSIFISMMHYTGWWNHG